MKKLIVLLYCALIGVLNVVAQQAYAVYDNNNTTLTFYYDNLKGTRPGTTYDLNTGSNHPGWYTDNNCIYLSHVVFTPSFANARPTSTYEWFCSKSLLESITGIAYLDTREVTNMAYMFSACQSLTSLDVSHFNTAKVTAMNSMFNYCNSLTSLDLSSFNTAKVTTMSLMFRNCSALTELDLSSFNTSQVTDMRYLFSDCKSLTSLDLSSFNTAKVTNMNSMFMNCFSLQSLDLSSFNTSQLYDMGYMFFECSSLRTIYGGDGWNTNGVTAHLNLFALCDNLVGGMGTVCEEAHWSDKAYARVDGGPSAPGYFTAKSSYLRGDVNGNGFVDISDVTALIKYLLTGDFSGIPVLENADCDQGGEIDISDVTALIDYLLKGSWR